MAVKPTPCPSCRARRLRLYMTLVQISWLAYMPYRTNDNSTACKAVASLISTPYIHVESTSAYAQYTEPQRRAQYIQVPHHLVSSMNSQHFFCSGETATAMTSARNSIYSTHSIADAHLLAILDEKQDNHHLDTQPSRLSALLPTKLLETVFILPIRKADDNEAGHGQEAASFDTMQKSIQVIGLSRPEKSKSRLSHAFETEYIIDNAAFDDDDDESEHLHYDPEPQMRYTAASSATSPEYTQQGCSGYRYPSYYGGCRRIGYCGHGNRGCSGPQRPPQCYFPGGRRQRRYGGGYYYGAGGGGCGYRGGGGGGYGVYGGVGRCYAQKPVLVRRHGCCCCC